MILSEFKKEFTTLLQGTYPKTEIDSFFSLLMEEYLGLKRINIVLNPSQKIEPEKSKILFNALSRLQKEEPIQYILGKTEFYGLPFFVNEHTLIPRPETEELVALVLKEIRDKNQDSLRLLDIGTGSGCIAISLKRELPHAKVSAIDVSFDALKIAHRNAHWNNVDIQFQQLDILKTEKLNESYDLIVSNPPYVRELEKAMMRKNVLAYEPQKALFVKDDNPLIFYQKIVELARQHLHQNGLLFFEINEYLGQETKELIKSHGFSQVEIKKDIFGKNRMIKATKS